MVTEYKGYNIEGRDDFKYREISENVTLFRYRPWLFIITEQDVHDFEANLSHELRESITIDLYELPKGAITLIVNPTIAAHYQTHEQIKDSIVKFIFDHRINEF